MDLTYRSPFEGDTDLTCDPLPDGMCLWAYQGIAALMPAMPPHWTGSLLNWYLARRDANLMGQCPLCDAAMPPVMAGQAFGAIRHERDCAMVAPAFVREWAGMA